MLIDNIEVVRMLDNAPSVAVSHQRPSITHVAERAGVSRAAVSKVIRRAYGVSPEMLERVQAAIDELGYRPRTAARTMRGQSFTIGFEIPQIGNDFFTQVLRGAASRLEGSGYQLILAPAINGHRGSSIIDSLVDRQVDGIIAVSPDVTPARLAQVASQIPVVILGRHDYSPHYDTVFNDDASGVALVMDHLRELGHERICHLTLEPAIHDPESVVPHAVRLQAYTDVMERASLRPDVRYSGTDEVDAYGVAREIFSSADPPTAVFAGNDTLAIGALRALIDSGLDRDRFAIVGYDGIDIAAHPLISLTTIDQGGERMGEIVIDLLMGRLREGRTSAIHEQTTPQLKIRRSTGVPSAAGVP